jgi:hypothetical protein
MTLAVAVYAAVVASASLVVAFLAYRQGGPRVKVRASVKISGNVDVEVTVYNRGRGAITIASGWASVAFTPNPPRVGAIFGTAVDGLPHRLEGHSSFPMTIPVDQGPHARAVRAMDSATLQQRIHGAFVVVGLGDGRMISVEVEQPRS